MVLVMVLVIVMMVWRNNGVGDGLGDSNDGVV